MESIEQIAAEGRIIRGRWSDTDEQGRHLLCLYTALAGDPYARPETCPADLCPRWLAHLLPWMDDAGTEAAWPSVVARVVALAPRLGEIQGEVSDRLFSRCLAHIVREAMSHTEDSGAIEACTDVLALLERHGSGGVVTHEEWKAAEAAVWAARAFTAAEAAAWAARAFTAAWAATGAASWAAPYEAAIVYVHEAADRMTDAILKEIEAFFPDDLTFGPPHSFY